MQNVGPLKGARRKRFRVNQLSGGQLINCTWKLAKVCISVFSISTKMTEHFAKERFAAELVMLPVSLHIRTRVFFQVELRLASCGETMQL